MRGIAKAVLPLIALMALAGCGERNVPYSKLDTHDVLVRVNGVDYEKGAFERDVRMFRKVNGLITAGSSRSSAPLDARTCQQVLDQFVARELLRREAQSRAIDVSDRELHEFGTGFVKTLPLKSALTFEDVLSFFDKERDLFLESIRKDALASKVSAHVRNELRAGCEPSAADVKAACAEAIEHNRLFAVTNRLMATLATNSWRSIVAGNDFAVVGEKLHQLNGYITYSPSCAGEGEDIRNLRSGQVTPPLERQGGLAIYKAVETKGDSRRYARIFFALAPIYVVESDENARQTIWDANVRESFEKWLRDLHESAKISYPFGRNPFHE